MMCHRPAAAKEGQRGFTLVELLVVIAITGLIGSVVAGAVIQVFSVSSRNTSRMTIVKQLENAVRWLTPDAQMADNVTGNLAGAGLSLTWKEWGGTTDNGTTNNVTYKMIANGQLERSYYRNGLLQSTKVVARNIDPARTSSSFANGTIAFTVTSAIGGYKPESITRSFNVTLRSI
jgi:prepilin-type N-terminal cleavage/methylation domain-containing protein